MHIGQPSVFSHEGRQRIAAAVQIDRPHPGLPDRIWHEFSPEHAAFINPEADTFVTALLPFAMNSREDIHVSGPISARLAYHYQRYQKILHTWRPDIFQPIQVHSQGFHPAPRQPVPEGVASMFSGGVDSFYTLGHHLPGSQPNEKYRLTHAIFLHNFDFPPDDESYITAAIDTYRGFLEPKGVGLIVGNSNARRFTPDWDVDGRRQWYYLTFGSFLASIGQALSGGIVRLLIPSSYTFLRTEPIGSDMRTDQLLSTERLEVVHHGIAETRMEKLKTLVRWPMTHALLRVCWWDARGVQNCCMCPKCVRTMISLEILGELSTFETFSKPLRLKYIHGLIGSVTYPFMVDMFRHAVKARHFKMVFITGYVALMSGIVRFGKMLFRWIKPKNREKAR